MTMKKEEIAMHITIEFIKLFLFISANKDIVEAGEAIATLYNTILLNLENID